MHLKHDYIFLVVFLFHICPGLQKMMQAELIPAEYTLVNKYLLNHYILFKLQRWQFGDFTNEEICSLEY